MHKRRQDSGFTLVETLIAVCVLVILMAIGFVSVANHQRTLKRLELDEAAKEIYIAAQNHLTMASSMGVLSTRDSSDSNEVGESHARMVDGANVTYHYFFVNGGDNIHSGTVLGDMLPRFSIDERVRTGGHYVIEYDLENAAVVNVFYCDQSDLSSHDYSTDDYGLFEDSDEGYTGESKADKRLAGYNGAILGWYGGKAAQELERKTLYAPKVEIINEECLWVKVSYATETINRMSSIGIPPSSINLKLIIADASKDEAALNGDGGEDLGTISVSWASETKKTKDGSTKQYVYKTYMLDDITSGASGHFANKFEELVAGEDVHVTANVSSTDCLGFDSKKSNTENSLYGGVAGNTATITNMRHLENLDEGISGIELDELGITKARQDADLKWSGPANSTAFLAKVFKNEARGGSESSASDIAVYDASGGKGAKACMLPVSPSEPLAYDGNGMSISSVKVEFGGPAGIFGELLDGSEIADLELIDCSSIKSSGSNGVAGTLLGKASGALTVKNVMAYDSNASDAFEVTAAGAAGGLIGMLEAGSSDEVKIDGCGAAVLVRATGSGSNAGGLIGKIYAQGVVEVKDCYAGGRTKANTGMYDDEKYNVTAKGAAGGLIGSIHGDGALIENCYTTASVSSPAKAGGFVGSCNGASITNCYCTGLVDGEATQKGAFAAVLASATLTDNKYFEIINGDLSALDGDAEAEAEELSSIDADTQTYDAFCKGETEAATAEPYDAALAKWYGNKYPYPSVIDLQENASARAKLEHYFVATHHGDWPSPETLLVNEKE